MKCRGDKRACDFRFHNNDDTSGKETGMGHTEIRLTGKHPIRPAVLYFTVFVKAALMQNDFCTAQCIGEF